MNEYKKYYIVFKIHNIPFTITDLPENHYAYILKTLFQLMNIYLKNNDCDDSKYSFGLSFNINYFNKYEHLKSKLLEEIKALKDIHKVIL